MSHHIGDVLAEVIRSGVVESFHTGHLCIINSDGSIGVTAGNIDAPFIPYSTIKSIQVAAMVRAGLVLSPQQLAVASASHPGSQVHLEIVESILHGAGLTVDALRNSQAIPIGHKERLEWGDKPPTQLVQNCSGKHAAMLATCVINGWELPTYVSVGHPIQTAIRQELEQLMTESISSVAMDGCGAPTFALTTRGFATAVHRLRTSQDPVHKQVTAACIDYPDLVAGVDRMNTRVMKVVPGLFMKDGVEGVQIFSLADGRACVFKINDGGYRATSTVMAAVLKFWDIDSGIEPVRAFSAGQVVGEVRSTVVF
jgi:L-asparaginase II